MEKWVELLEIDFRTSIFLSYVKRGGWGIKMFCPCGGGVEPALTNHGIFQQISKHNLSSSLCETNHHREQPPHLSVHAVSKQPAPTLFFFVISLKNDICQKPRYTNLINHRHRHDSFVHFGPSPAIPARLVHSSTDCNLQPFSQADRARTSQGRWVQKVLRGGPSIASLAGEGRVFH